LHPQLQAVLLDYLREQAEASPGDGSFGPVGRIQIIATTHSSNLASSVGVENVVVLRTKHQVEHVEVEGGQTDVIRRMTCALPLVNLNLSPNEFRKINQYLDATRAAVLFARRIILVEGVAEAVLLPVLARKLVFAHLAAKRREFHAVTIVNVGSVDFEPYIKLLLGTVDGLRVLERLVVITDRDPALPSDNGAEDSELSNRPAKLASVAAALGAEGRLVVTEAAYTLEADLLTDVANRSVLEQAYLKQHPRSRSTWEQIVAATNPAEALYRKLRTNKKFISKGEFAHDVAIAIESGQPFAAPPYLRDAITSVVSELGEPGAAPGVD